MPLTVLVAAGGFKESLSPADATRAIARGVAHALPDAVVLEVPLADSGEGFVDTVVGATGGRRIAARVSGPLGGTIDAHFGFLGGDERTTAVIEIAAAAGLSKIPRKKRDPMRATTRGVGDLIRAALDHGAKKIIIGCGDSGTNDAGVGMAQALGARLLTSDGDEIEPGGKDLARIARIDLSKLDPRLETAEVVGACNWHNVLLGSRGVARIFGPQKGASPEQVELLERGLAVFAERVLAATGRDVGSGPGTGASGGIGAGIAGLLGGELVDRWEVCLAHSNFDRYLARADIVFTAEGAIDTQTPYGKVPGEVGRRASRLGKPVIALAGQVDADDANLATGISATLGILRRPLGLEQSIANTEVWLEATAANAARAVSAGLALANHKRHRLPSLRVA